MKPMNFPAHKAIRRKNAVDRLKAEAVRYKTDVNTAVIAATEANLNRDNSTSYTKKDRSSRAGNRVFR